ncbi:hypothetical protein OPQ81_011885 [Rhizoctonia solani]|nr:hypothetical protein OPQ81_002668 [Rhizoctonia solani]KAJ1300132.1 hypothetical protein OPQ81_011885 [Rhizoctonia solani]
MLDVLYILTFLRLDFQAFGGGDNFKSQESLHLDPETVNSRNYPGFSAEGYFPTGSSPGRLLIYVCKAQRVDKTRGLGAYPNKPDERIWKKGDRGPGTMVGSMERVILQMGIFRTTTFLSQASATVNNHPRCLTMGFHKK